MDDIIFYRNKNGNANSIYPPQTFLTFEYWIFMVPQYKPKNVLMLGYADGTVAGLIRLIWGDVPITAVDNKPSANRYGVDFIKTDAREFVKTCKEYDAIIIDLFDSETGVICDFVNTQAFVDDLTRIGNYLIINSLGTNMSAYKHLKKIGMNKASGSGALIYYYETKSKIPNLHPYK
jgi:hypothetical protein